MMNKLWIRLSLSLLAVTGMVIGMVALVVRQSVETSFNEYVQVRDMARFGEDIVAQLETYYADNGTWTGATDLLPERGRGQGQGADMSGERGAQLFIADTNSTIVAATQSEWIGQNVASVSEARTVPLLVDGEQVGQLGEQTPGTLALDQAEAHFLDETTRGLLLTALLGGLAVLGMSIALAYTLTRPLRRLTDDIQNWQLSPAAAPVRVSGTDEVRQLGRTFNDLLGRLAKGEAQRQQMAADVAHELRTPVTIMRGHLEGMMDGIYPMDTAHLAVAYDQVLHLSRLVEDMRLLTQAEAGRLPLKRRIIEIGPLVKRTVERFKPLVTDAGSSLSYTLQDDLPPVYADPDRLQQVFDNLLRNAIQYTPEDGQIAIQGKTSADKLYITLYNDNPNVDDTTVNHLFDRFWRADQARERDSAGSGLGMAITRQLLHLQDGEIYAARTDTGLEITFTLPAANRR